MLATIYSQNFVINLKLVFPQKEFGSSFTVSNLIGSTERLEAGLQYVLSQRVER